MQNRNSPAAVAIAALSLTILTSTTRAADPAPGHVPTLYVIGDSTVKNGHDNGSNGQWGWGHILPAFFDLSKIHVENDALGGTSSRSYMESSALWPAVLAKLQAGDFVIMQFGHNDNTAAPEKDNTRWRSTLKGNGEETVQGLVKSGGTETVHSYGWYIRQYITQAKAKGATAIVCSLIPRDAFTDDKVHRADNGYALWAQQAAEQVGGLFLPLNKLIADKYDALGKEKSQQYFPTKETTHTNWEGAELNAECVATGIKDLDSSLKNYLLPHPTLMPEPEMKPTTKPDSADPQTPK